MGCDVREINFLRLLSYRFEPVYIWERASDDPFVRQKITTHSAWKLMYGLDRLYTR